MKYNDLQQKEYNMIVDLLVKFIDDFDGTRLHDWQVDELSSELQRAQKAVILALFLLEKIAEANKVELASV